MMAMTRRKYLVASSLAAIAATGCTGWIDEGGTSRVTSLVDAHCHLFNVTDLPAANFIQVSVLEDYDRSSIVGGPLRAIGALLEHRVPTARNEANWDSQNKLLHAVEPVSRDDETKIETETLKAQRALDAIGKSALLAKSCKPDGGSLSPSVRSAVDWLRTLRHSRRALADDLARSYRSQGITPALLCPALVDYSNWLGQPLTSKLPDQVAAMRTVARNPDLPPVHGYVAYDPLRRALVRERRTVIDGGFDPLDLVRTAIDDAGFIGIKLYPPTGFRATGNARSGDRYPADVERAFGDAEAVGKALDESLEELWTLARQLGVGVMAHSYFSNQAGCGYGARAEPAFWLPLFDGGGGVPVMLAHMGRFDLAASVSGQPHGKPTFEGSWEGTFAAFIQQRPDAPLYGDISYLSEVWRAADARRVRDNLRRYRAYDPDMRHLIYGSDWVMLGLESGYRRPPGYAASVIALLESAGITGTALTNVMQDNALRFLQLGEGGRNRERLRRFYADMPEKFAQLPVPRS